jgi:hypothetical protein
MSRKVEDKEEEVGELSSNVVSKYAQLVELVVALLHHMDVLPACEKVVAVVVGW